MSDFMPDYRAKRIDNGKWVEGNYVWCRHHHYILEWYDKYGYDERWEKSEWVEIKPETLCKNTTATMPDGSIVWSGDIFRSDKSLYIIVWDDCNYKWDAKRNKFFDPTLDFCNVIGNYPRIGNRHDNPEMVGAK